ncbi:MAG: exodeoxyribonuclease VII small subunit [Dehalococcoidia bacterium]
MPRTAREEAFEQIYARLEEAVARLEQGGLPLEEAIALYEQGMALARQCQQRLDAAELKITKLKESFAPLPRRDDGAGEPVEEYEYASSEDTLPEEDGA